MKKSIATIATLLIVLTVLAMPVTAFANSAQRHFEGATSSGTVVTTENCPITVTAERLTFNINSYPPIHNDGEWADYNANVTAEYDFYNPADYLVKMQLVFPFGNINDYAYYGDFNDTDKYSVYVNDKEVERTVRATYTRYGAFDLEKDIAKISDEPVLFKGFADDTVVYRYTLSSRFEHVEGVGAENYRANFVIDGLTLLSDNGAVSCFSLIDNNNVKHLIARGSGMFTLYSIGQPLADEFFLSAEYSAEMETSKRASVVSYDLKPVNGSTQVSALTTLTLGELLMANYTDELGVSKLDYRNAVVNKISDTSSPVVDVRNIEKDNIKHNLMYWYQYNVTVPSKHTVTNKVVAPLYPDINMDYSPATYTYAYLLSPASSWASFVNLDVTINTTSYMLSNSLDGFTRTDNGYAAHFDTLPQGELTFVLCDDEKPKYNDYGSFVWTIIFLVIILPAILGVLIIVAAIVVPIVVVRKRKKSKQQSSDTTCIVQPTEQAEDIEKIKEDVADRGN